MAAAPAQAYALSEDGRQATREAGQAATGARELRYAVPWGQHFPEPIFDGCFHLVHQRIVGDRHLKLVVAPEEAPEQLLDAIAFNVDTDRWPDDDVEALHLADFLAVVGSDHRDIL